MTEALPQAPHTFSCINQMIKINTKFYLLDTKFLWISVTNSYHESQKHIRVALLQKVHILAQFVLIYSSKYIFQSRIQI